MRLIGEIYWWLYDYCDRFSDRQLHHLITAAMAAVLALAALFARYLAEFAHLIRLPPCRN